MGESFLNKSGGGGKINGLIKEYYVYAGEEISPGSFVDFVNGIGGISTSTSSGHAVSTANSSWVCACKLTDENVVVIFQGASIGYAYLLKVSASGVISVLKNGSPFGDESIAYPKMVARDSSRVFIAYVAGGTTATLGLLDTSLLGQTGASSSYAVGSGTSSYPDMYTDIAILDDERCIITWNRERSGSASTSYGLQAVILDHSNSSIKFGTTTSIEIYQHHHVSVCALDSSRAMISYQDVNSSKYGTSQILTISGTTITAGTEYAFDTTGAESVGTGYIEQKLLEPNKVIMAYNKGTNGGLTQIASVDGSVITFGTAVAHQVAAAYWNNISIVNESKVILAWSYAVSKVFYCRCATISGTTITLKTAYTPFGSSDSLTISYLSTVLLDNYRLLVSYNNASSNACVARVVGIDGDFLSTSVLAPTYETQVKRTLDNVCRGVAKTRGVGGTSEYHLDKVKVYVPNI